MHFSERPQALGGVVSTQKWLRRRSLSSIADEALDDDRGLTVEVDHPRDEVNALQHHRPALGERAVDRRLDADEHVVDLVEETQRRRASPASSSSAFVRAKPASKLE